MKQRERCTLVTVTDVLPSDWWTTSDVARFLDGARDTEAWSRRATPLEMVLQPAPPLDPLDAPGPTTETLEAHRRAGATALALRFLHRSPDHYVEQLEALQELV